jgi:hypothetical protein
MNLRRNRMLSVAAFGLFALCASAKPAAAQGNVYKGSFTLQNEVRWQGKVMPAGDYTFWMSSTGTPNQIQVQGPDRGFFVLAIGNSRKHSSEKSELIIEQRGDSRFVRELYLADFDLHIKYFVPKAPKEELLVKGPVTTEHVIVARAGK